VRPSNIEDRTLSALCLQSCGSFLRSRSFLSQKQFSEKFLRSCDSQNRGISNITWSRYLEKGDLLFLHYGQSKTVQNRFGQP